MNEMAKKFYDEYIRKCSRTYGITEEEARTHKICKEVEKYYAESTELRSE